MDNIDGMGFKKLSYTEANSINGGVLGIIITTIGLTKDALEAAEMAYKQLKHGIDDGFNQTD